MEYEIKMNIKKITALCLSALTALSLIGCKNSGSAPGDKYTAGKYVETEIVPSGYTMAGVFKGADGCVYTYGYLDDGDVAGEDFVIRNENGDDIPCQWGKEIDYSKCSIDKVFCGNDGKTYAVLTNYENDFFYTLSRINDDGSTTDVTPEYWTTPIDVGNDMTLYPYLVDVWVDKNGNVIFSDMSCNQIMMNNGIPVASSSNNDETSFSVFGDKVYSFSEDMKFIRCTDTKSMTVTDEIPVEFIVENAMIHAFDGGIYIICKSGIYLRADNSSVWECVAAGTDYRMGSASYSPKSVFTLDDGRIIISYMSDTDYSISAFGYIYDENAVSVAQTPLTIYSLFDSTTVSEGIIRFKKQHPEYNVKYIIASDNSSATLSDKIRALNTEILSGNGADIIILDGLPKESYIEKGVLLDMSDILSPMAEDGELLNNVAKNYSYNGKIYSMPVKYAPNYYIADSETINSELDVASLAKLSQEYSDDRIKFLPQSNEAEPLNEHEYYFYYLIGSYYDTLLSENKTLDKEKFSAFIEDVKTIADTSKNGITFAEGTEHKANEKNPYIINTNNASPLVISLKQYHSTLNSAFSIEHPTQGSLLQDEFNLGYKNFANTYIPCDELSINAASNNPDGAKAFVSFMMSEKMQSENLRNGLPVNAVAFDNYFNNAVGGCDGCSISGTNDDGLEFMINIETITAEEAQEFKEMALRADKPIFCNSVIIDALYQSADGYFSGNMTSDEAASDAAEKLRIYYDE